jgi:hypothetical protein
MTIIWVPATAELKWAGISWRGGFLVRHARVSPLLAAK